MDFRRIASVLKEWGRNFREGVHGLDHPRFRRRFFAQAEMPGGLVQIIADTDQSRKPAPRLEATAYIAGPEGETVTSNYRRALLAAWFCERHYQVGNAIICLTVTYGNYGRRGLPEETPLATLELEVAEPGRRRGRDQPIVWTVEDWLLAPRESRQDEALYGACEDFLVFERRPRAFLRELEERGGRERCTKGILAWLLAASEQVPTDVGLYTPEDLPRARRRQIERGALVCA